MKLRILKRANYCRLLLPKYNLCRIEITASHVTTYMLLAVLYFIAHSGKMWPVRCVAAISSGVELLNTYITNPALYAECWWALGLVFCCETN